MSIGHRCFRVSHLFAAPLLAGLTLAFGFQRQEPKVGPSAEAIVAFQKEYWEPTSIESTFCYDGNSRKGGLMLRSIRQLYGKTLGASDGDIGSVEDFYFNDQQWVVRYVIVDTGSWLPGRQVLISPHGFRDFPQKGDSLEVILSREQIENSPTIASHKPVSRQYEEEYYRYYGWPSYWDGGGMWGMGEPALAPSADLSPGQQTAPDGAHRNDADSHLRSTRSMNGYHIQTSDGSVGHISDFVMDDSSWTIRHLVVETGHWFAGKKIVLSPESIDRISYEESTVFVTKTKEAILAAPEYHVSPLDES
jgi:sporulation protein YlmC with PRC-barrel domain